MSHSSLFVHLSQAIRLHSSRVIVLIVMMSLLTTSVSTAPQTIVASSGKMFQAIRFEVLSSGIFDEVPASVALLLGPIRRSSNRSASVAAIRIYPEALDLNV